MATRINAHEERLATLNSIMNVIAILDLSSPRRSVSDRWIDVRALMPVVENEADVEDEWTLVAADATAGLVFSAGSGPVSTEQTRTTARFLASQTPGS